MDVWIVVRYDRFQAPRVFKDPVGVFSTFELARQFTASSEEADERDYDIEQHTVNHPEASQP
jgi:hypothetical protein